MFAKMENHFFRSIALIEIQLPNGTWSYDPNDQLGPEGGFGVVFRGESSSHGPTAVKKLKISAADAAHRELTIAHDLSGHSFEHVIPFWDSGQDASSGDYFVVMPIATKSLADDIGSPFDESDAISVLLQLASGLQEAKSYVHRDLKPGNILFHDGKWKLADFGIARFVEKSTSVNTLKDCLTPHYAAPEQWNYERSSNATDIYALGCIAFEMLSGDVPFPGPDFEDFKEQHLQSTPPDLSASSWLKTLVRMMLRKPAAGRPKIERVISILTQCNEAGSTGQNPAAIELASAADNVEKLKAIEYAKEQSKRSAEQVRSDLARHAYSELKNITDELSAYIERIVPNVQKTGNHSSRKWILGIGTLLVQTESGYVVGQDEFPRSGWDVVAYGTVGASQQQPEYNWWSSLWYTNRGDSSADYRWYEVAYFTTPLMKSRRQFEPFHLSGDFAKADEGVAKMLGTVSIAFGPVAIDDENQSDFFERWAKLFARAAKGGLSRPRELPIKKI